MHAGLLPQKNGVRFEATLRKREERNPRFAFLLPDNEHHCHYRFVASPVAAQPLCSRQ